MIIPAKAIDEAPDAVGLMGPTCTGKTALVAEWVRGEPGDQRGARVVGVCGVVDPGGRLVDRGPGDDALGRRTVGADVAQQHRDAALGRVAQQPKGVGHRGPW